MKKENIVFSIGGSLIFGDEIDISFYHKIRDILEKYINRYNFAIVCGGGKVAREYTKLAKMIGLSEKIQDILGIDATRLNARLMTYVLNNLTTGKVYRNIEELVKDFGNKITICGGIKPGQRTDKVAADIAERLGIKILINLTDVDGVVDKNPKEYKNAKLIPKLDYNKFVELSGVKKHIPSYHFVFDFDAAEICHKNKIKVVIINGHKLDNLDKFLAGNKFIGSIIEF